MAFDSTSPSQGHQALNDIDQIRGNCVALREFEASPSTSPPSNPVAGQFWWANDTKTMYQRNQANNGWAYRWSEDDPPAHGSDVTAHVANNITTATAVHGIKQGSGNALDADTVDGQHASAFLTSTHANASSGVHGAGSNVILHAPTTTPFLVIAATAPTGWTQVTTWHDRVLRIVSGTGASIAGSWTISGLAHTHSVASDGAHGHSQNTSGATSYVWAATQCIIASNLNGAEMHTGANDYSSPNQYNLAAGVQSVGTHNHGGTTGSGGSSDGTWRPAYLDVIAVMKNL